MTGLAVAFVAALGWQVPKIVIDASGNECIHRVKAILTIADVPGPLTVTTYYPSRRGSGSEFVLADGNQRQYSCSIDPHSSCPRRISIRSKESEAPHGNLTQDFHMDRLRKRVSRWGSELDGKHQTELNQIRSDKSRAMAVAYFSTIKDGHTISKPGVFCGYTITFTVPDGRFVAMEAEENPPLVDPLSPVVTKAEANRICQQILVSEIEPKAQAQTHRVPAFRLGECSISYLLDGRSPAHLVWTAWYSTTFEGPNTATGFGFIRIDAISGKRLPGG